MARSMLVHHEVGENFWGGALMTAAYVRNRSETSALDNTISFEVCFGKKPSISHQRVFGCKAIVCLSSKRKKNTYCKAYRCMVYTI